MSDTISNIKVNGTTYAINDSTKAGLEEISVLTNVAQNNTELLNSAQTKLDELLSKVEDSGLDTSDATALASQILLGKTAYVNGVKVVGTLDLSNLLPENLVSGVVINGVSGIHVCENGGTGGGETTPEYWERLVVTSMDGSQAGTYIAVEKSGREPDDFTGTIWTLNGGSAENTTCIIHNGTQWVITSSKYFDIDYAWSVPATNPNAPWEAMAWSTNGITVQLENA